MNNRSGADSGYFGMVISVAIVSMFILIWIHLPEYTGGGHIKMMIPVVVCALLIILSVPVLKYVKKSARGGANSNYYQAANLFAIVSMVSFILIRLPEYISRSLYFNAAVLLAACLGTVTVMVVLMVRVKNTSQSGIRNPRRDLYGIYGGNSRPGRNRLLFSDLFRDLRRRRGIQPLQNVSPVCLFIPHFHPVDCHDRHNGVQPGRRRKGLHGGMDHRCIRLRLFSHAVPFFHGKRQPLIQSHELPGRVDVHDAESDRDHRQAGSRDLYQQAIGVPGVY
jgi:hypothetical protein